MLPSTHHATPHEDVLIRDFPAFNTAPPSLPSLALRYVVVILRSDTRLQFATLRDPRPMTVSAYFHRVNDKSRSVEGVTVDEYVRGYLAAACQWVALRYYLFEGVLAETSSVFWYDEAITDIVGMHLQWMKFAGLQLPMRAVDGMVESARALSSKSVNKHPGGTNSADRSWEDEVGVDVVRDAEEILRAYLPPVLLIRWGIEP